MVGFPKNNLFKYPALLFIFYLVICAFWTVVPRGQALNLKDVVPQAAAFEAVRAKEGISYYRALDRKKNLLGYVFKTSKRGYSSEIVTLVGINPQGEIIRIKILSQDETPGLGARVDEVIEKAGRTPRPWFQEQFSGKKIETLDRSVQAISGATITSAAVIDSIKDKAREVLAYAQPH